MLAAQTDAAAPVAELSGRPRALDWTWRGPVVSVDGSRGGVYVMEPTGRRDRLANKVATSIAAATRNPVILTDDGDIFQISIPME